MTVTVHGQVRTHHHGFSLASRPDLPTRLWRHSPTTGLVSTREGEVRVETGLHTASLPLTVEIHDLEPPLCAGWDDVAEVSVPVPAGVLLVTDTPVPNVFPNLTPHGPGTYRIRAHANGREASHQGSDTAEHHLLQIWPAPHAPDLLLHLTPQARRRLQAAAHPAPDPALVPRPPGPSSQPPTGPTAARQKKPRCEEASQQHLRD